MGLERNVDLSKELQERRKGADRRKAINSVVDPAHERRKADRREENRKKG